MCWPITGHLPVPGDSVRGVLLPPEHLPPHPSGGRGGKGVEESPTCAGVLCHLPGRDLPFGEARKGGQGAGVPRLRDQAGRPQGDLRVLAVRGGRGVGHQLAPGGAGAVGERSAGGKAIRERPSRDRGGGAGDLPLLKVAALCAVRDTLAKVRKKDREALAQDLKAIYRADTVKQAHRALRALEEKWAGKYPELVAKWLDKRPSRSS